MQDDQDVGNGRQAVGQWLSAEILKVRIVVLVSPTATTEGSLLDKVGNGLLN